MKISWDYNNRYFYNFSIKNMCKYIYKGRACMAKRGKSINLYLMDGEVTGRIKCTLANWTGIAYKIPRVDLEKSKDREDLKQSGIYFLFGNSEETGEETVYIGQTGIRKNGEGILYRILEHNRDHGTDYFNEAVILTTQNNSFGPTEISYLESSFTFLSKEAARYIVKNANEPSVGNVTEEKESELKDFIDYSKMVIGALGYKIFVPLLSSDSSEYEGSQEAELSLYLNRKSNKSDRIIEAQCKRTKEGFVVLAGSMIEVIDSYHIPKMISEERKKAKIDRKGKDKRLLENKLFKSPSYAAAFVLGMNTNGRLDWKNKDGVTLKELEENNEI